MLQFRCFSVNFAKFLRILFFLQNTYPVSASALIRSIITSNRLMPITEAYLEPSRKSTSFAKSPIVDSDWILKVSDNSKIVTVLYYRNRFTIQRDKLHNRATQVK